MFIGESMDPTAMICMLDYKGSVYTKQQTLQEKKSSISKVKY